MIAMKKVWSGDVVEHESDFLSWHGFKSYPLPVQKINNVPSVPIVMGGKAGKIYERIAKYGDGWFIPGAGIDDLPPMLADLRAACEAERRNYDDIELTTMWGPKGGADSLKALADLGISRVVTILDGSGVDGINAIAEAHIR
jgi:alkanesulfonate monooxygenase SsuD/methylene tetrahydromethanopterin reductase-like flavin-dependent oxidoreductase (luciferase family)